MTTETKAPGSEVALRRLVRLRFAARIGCVYVEPTPYMPATATHATQSENEGPWRFWSESNENPVAIWQDDEMKSALREIAAKKTNAERSHGANNE